MSDNITEFSRIYRDYGFGSDESRSGFGSTIEQTEGAREGILKLIKERDIKTIVDVPCGDFNWMKLIVFRFESYTGGDIVPKCIEDNNTKYANSIIKFNQVDLINDDLNEKLPQADLMLVRDVIGHLTIDDSIKAIRNIAKSKCKYLLTTTWYNVQDSTTFNNNFINKGAEKPGMFYPVNLLAKPFFFPEPEATIVETVPIENYEKGDRKVLALWNLEKLREHLAKIPEPRAKPVAMSKDLLIVSGLWNIGRPGRDFSHYLEHFDKFLQIPAYMFLYVPRQLESFVWERRSPQNTCVRVFELDDVRKIYGPFWDKTQEIRTSEKWQNITGENGWLKSSPQSTLEWYNPIVQSKMFMLHDAKILSPWNNEYMVWLDAGITNTVYDKYLVDQKALDKLIPHLKTFLFLSYPYDTTTEIHGFDKKAMDRYANNQDVKYVCRGGLFGGHRDYLSNANSTYYSTLHSTLFEGYMGTEESIFTLMSYREPHIYRRYQLDGNGLIQKFIEALITDSVKLVDVKRHTNPAIPKGTYNENLTKTSLYMLTFNFPEQVLHTIKTWEANSPLWLSAPRKILIDNSTNPEAVERNRAIARDYGFEHLPTGRNIGINGGRVLAAEHFHESDSDYYFFFEDDMGLYGPNEQPPFCRNGFRKFIPNLYRKVHQIMAKEELDFLKLSYTEVYMDNNIQVSWYNVPQVVRTAQWPEYDKLPVTGLDPYAPRTRFDRIEVLEELSYAIGEVYYANWPMIVSKAGNKKMFIDTKWAHPFEQTLMSHMYQETLKKNITPGVLLAAPVHHNRIVYYKPDERREN